MYVEDFKRGSNKDIGPKDIFEMGSKLATDPDWQLDRGNIYPQISQIIISICIFLIIFFKSV